MTIGTVAATDPADQLYPWSTRGPWVTLAAPGCTVSSCSVAVTFVPGGPPLTADLGAASGLTLQDTGPQTISVPFPDLPSGDTIL